MKKFNKWLICSTILFSVFQGMHVYGSARSVVDLTAPSIPGGLRIDNRTNTSLLISWDASSDNVAVQGYQVYRDGKKIITISKTSFTNVDLIPGREYCYSVRAYDASGNVSDGSSQIKAVTIEDSQAPGSPSGLKMTSVDYTSIGLVWKPSVDNTSLKGYEIYCNGSRKASTSATSYICKNLIPGKSYTFFVKAYDIAGNDSDESNQIMVVTNADNASPSIPANVTVSDITGTEAELAWLASLDNVKIKGYEVFSDNEKISTTSKTSYTYKNLIPGNTYNITIRAFDTMGNYSNRSSAIKFTAKSDNAAPTAPSGLKIKTTKSTSIALDWIESKDDIKVKGYRIYCNGLEIATATRTSKTLKLPKSTIIGVIYVKAYDLAGKLSAASNKVTVIM